MKKFIFGAILMMAFSLDARNFVADPDEATCAAEAMAFGDLVESITGNRKAAYRATEDYYVNCMQGTKLILLIN